MTHSSSFSLQVLSFGWWFPPHRTPVDFRGLSRTKLHGGTVLQCDEREVYVHEFGEISATQHLRCLLSASDAPESVYEKYASSITNAYGPADSAFVAFIAEHGGRPDVIVIGHCMGAGLTRATLLAESLSDRIIVTSWNPLPSNMARRYASLGVKHVMRSRILERILSLKPAPRFDPLPSTRSNAVAEL